MSRQKTTTTNSRKTTTNSRTRRTDSLNREQQLRSLFGPHKGEVPSETVNYIRKNPKRFVQKITEIYGLSSVVKWVGESTK